ncbi:unnamed protein product [Cylicocyclus nassatus]|uniref:Apple domain-containing protein n=1 Tax=Cylicocyclus nassatus TaxID=53992 RepID=A0AA36GX45_CYLNA|nr:unnamed protein product [Cylicocyclus nassatus]
MVKLNVSRKPSFGGFISPRNKLLLPDLWYLGGYHDAIENPRSQSPLLFCNSAMKWLAFVLLFIQAEFNSSCIFDKVEEFLGKSLRWFQANENQCFAACYGDMNCTALTYKEGSCSLYSVGVGSHQCTTNASVCYILQRDEVAPVCARYANF